jgi:hypothetical protein
MTKQKKEICGNIHPSKGIICDLKKGHSGKHKGWAYNTTKK